MPDTQTADAPHDIVPAQISAQPGPPTLLFVDDDTLIRDLMGEGLRHKGYNVIQAEDGPTALAWLATAEKLDLMITDYSMPEMTGLELIIHVRATRPGLPVFLLTGYADDQVAQTLDTVTAGKGVLLHKPIRLQELATRIAAALAGSL